MKHSRRQAEPGTERGQQPSGPGRRGFLQQAGLAAIVVGGLETLATSQASAATTGTATAGKRSAVPPSKNVGAVYPRTGRPGPGTKSDEASPDGITWYRSAGHGGSGQDRCYFWYDSNNGEYGGPVRA
jgi:hypothetical protein